jgi:hypothetical protein
LTTSTEGKATERAVWRGRPSIGVYLMLYGILAFVAAAVLILLEFSVASLVNGLSGIFSASINLGPVAIPYVVEVGTALIILIVYLSKAIGLVLFRAGHSYELRTDGLYVNSGIANLQNTFISAMAFSDARLVRTLGMRVVGRSLIVVEANDGRRFEMRMIKDGPNVQSLIRSNLSHPMVRVEK